MEAYDLSRKLQYAGRHSPVPFFTGPEFTNSVAGVPVLSMLRIFITPEHWSEENLHTAAREVARVLGPTEQFDVGITLGQHSYDPHSPAAGMTARVIKLDPREPNVILRIADGNEDRVYIARFPRLQFESVGEDEWQSVYSLGARKVPSQP